MKGINPSEMPSNTCISTHIFRCRKGIYEAYQLDAQWGINYQMQSIDGDIPQLSNYRGE